MEDIKEKDNLTADGGKAADTAEAESNNKAAAATGKFKDVQTLLKAYSELEAEFTRRSQRLKELEKGNKTERQPDGVEAAPSPTEEELISCALSNAKVRDAVIGDYLKGVSEKREVPLTAGGGGIAAPRVAPRSVKDAGKLALEFLKK